MVGEPAVKEYWLVVLRAVTGLALPAPEGFDPNELGTVLATIFIPNWEVPWVGEVAEAPIEAIVFAPEVGNVPL